MHKELESKNEVIDVYTRVITILWEKTADILGSLTVSTIMDTATSETKEKYKFMEGLEISKEGLLIKEDKNRLMNTPKEVIEKAFEELISRFFDVLSVLTGDVLVSRLDPEVKKILKENR